MKERVLSAFIALLIVIPLVLLGGNYFSILVVILGLLGLKELLNLKKNIPDMMKYICYVLFIILIFYGYTYNGKILLMNFSFILISFIILFFSLIYYSDNKKYSVEDVFYLLSSIIFLSAAFNLFIVIRSEGLLLTLYLLLVTTITDTFAYICGCKYGKRKLIPKISPNKTVEGFLAGLLFGTVISSAFYIVCVDNSTVLLTILISFILSIVGQCGDLIFSQVKRHYGIKDFSNIMPGHGGILDRLDSIIFVLFGYIIISVIF